MMVDGKLAIEGGKPVREPVDWEMVGLPGLSAVLPRKVGSEEIEAVVDVLRQGLATDRIKEFEEAFAKAHGVRYGVAVNSGTSAPHTAVFAIGLRPGEEVICGPISDPGSIIGIIAQKAIPVFGDVDPRTLNIMAIHLCGQPCDMDPILKIAKKHNLVVIEDAAQSHFAEYKGKKAGSIGDIACFSLWWGKQMMSGNQGGMVITNDKGYADRARFFADGRGCSITSKEGFFYQTAQILGFNYRMDQMQAAVGLAQLAKLDEQIKRRIEAAELLTSLLKEIEGISPPYIVDGAKHTYWLYPFWMQEGKFQVSNYQFAKALCAEGVPCMPKEYYLLCDHKMLLERRAYEGIECPFRCPQLGTDIKYTRGMCPKAEKTLRECIFIVWHQFFSGDDVRDMARAIQKVADHYRRS
jgi:dTDP-4-amino-4,6-dideoxygalactose transaminase